jgi:hypothetical protein
MGGASGRRTCWRAFHRPGVFGVLFVTLLEAPLSPPLFRRRCLTSGVCVQLFQIVPLQALGVGPEVSNNMTAPHNCIGGSEVTCLPPMSEASLMFADPSKMQNMAGVPLPSHWYKAPVEFM